jgi:uncharacterized protein YyaL (SSP411 family)
MMSKNRLADETSPYLRQHADNPVHWWPWSPEALAEAQRSNRPILLSVGYAACHWCHVMAHESFEDPATAEVMNELYVNIKVDREERPDVDQVNMSALHAMGQQGGWPLTMFLTPAGTPFFGGTYFPNKPNYGRPSFVDVLRGVAQTYKERVEDVTSNAAAIMQKLRPQPSEGAVELTRGDLDTVAGQLAGVMDPVHGGLKGAPKFPNTPLLEFLWRAGDRTGDPRFHKIFLHAMDRISQGGMYDHIGGGYARYSVDELWLVPHFEKMLYDNAQLLELLAVAFQTSGHDLFRRRAAETVAWLEREMTLPGGGFASSLDADSEGHEGKFYVWTRAEIDTVLGTEDGAFFARSYDITPDGNFEGTSIPNRLTASINDAEEPRLEALRAKLLAARAARIRPGLDDKILADWNGLMIAALTRASLTFSKPAWLALAERAFRFVDENMSKGRRLGHSWRDGRLVYPGFASDLASMARAATALYEVTGTTAYLAKAEAWISALDENHGSSGGAYDLTASDGEVLAVRPSADKDEAVPSATGLALDTKFRLAALTGKDVYRETADVSMARVSVSAAKNVYGHLSVLSALDTRLAGLEILITGDADGKLTSAARALPFIARTVRPISDVSDLADDHPAKSLASRAGVQALVCAGEVCGFPVTTAEALAESATAQRRGNL